MDPIARLTELLSRVEIDGGKVISTLAVRRALSDQPDPPVDVHILVMTDRCWHIRHPDACPDMIPCPVVASAKMTLAASSYTDGEYEAWVGQSGWLCTQAVQP